MTRKTVLLVDQNESLLTALSELLTGAGHTVVPCRCFEEGRRYLQNETPHAIVTDLRLGDFNGLHLVLLAKDKAPAIAAIVYSGRDDSGIGGDAASGGASYLETHTLLVSLVPHLNARLSVTAQPSLPGDLAVASS